MGTDPRNISASEPNLFAPPLIIALIEGDRVTSREPLLSPGIGAREAKAGAQAGDGDPRRTHERVPVGRQHHSDLDAGRKAQHPRPPGGKRPRARPLDHHRIRRGCGEHHRVRGRLAGPGGAQFAFSAAEGHGTQDPELPGAEDGVAVASETQ